MKLIITIDTEEDNWGEYDTDNITLENIAKIDFLQELFDRYGVTPTYLVTYPVATDHVSIHRLRRIMEGGRCEIGTHCHPWNTPPFEEARNDRNSMLCNLDTDLLYRKIDTLHQVIARNFGIVPTSFRAGRWGFCEEIPRILSQLGYKVDSSIIACQDLRDYGGPDFSEIFPSAFMWGHREETKDGLCSQLLEMPATTGFTQQNFQLSNQVWQMLGSKFMQKLHVKGILDRLRLLNKIWLSPEKASSSEMIRLTTTMMHQGYKIANMFFHTTSLKAGLSPFVKIKSDEGRFLRRIEEFLVFTKHAGIESIKLSDVPVYLKDLVGEFRTPSKR